MQRKLHVLRKIKAFLLKVKFHLLFEPFSEILFTFVYLLKLSQWVSKTSFPPFNDFYSKKHDYSKRYDLYRYIVNDENLDEICYLEFGVGDGHSFRWWVENNKNIHSKFFGFDTFIGLPEKWGHMNRGAMSTDGNIPKMNDKRCEFRKGLFQLTVPRFLRDFGTNQRKVVHLDADLYSSTLYVLTMLGSRLRENDILIFDEFNVPIHEFRAFSDFTSSYQIKYKVIGCINNYHQIAFKIL